MEKIDYILSKKTIEELVSDPIGVKPARDLAYIYLNIPPRNGGFNHHEFFGGYFNASEFELTNHVGIRLWYCMVNENAKFPKFFLALEKLTSYDDTNPEETTNMAINLNVPKSIKYNGKSPQKDDILDHLKSNLFKKISGKFRTIPKGLVLEYSTNFRNFIRKNSKDESNPIDPYSKYVVAFFFKK
ncbi:hypothetical protein [Aquiflexum sp.]|uniref:hypothetical protein n=1 Tax=Aquiflexum sp. TaxID=1872584 RepID=UPI00359338FA